MEIERKFKVRMLPAQYKDSPHCMIEQAYLCTNPVVRVRCQDDQYYLTYKGKGLLEREEYNLPLTRESYVHLLAKADGLILTKTRYQIPLSSPWDKGSLSLIAELDVFSGDYEGLLLVGVEFPSKETALAFTPPDWFGEDVTFSGEYQNSRLSKGKKVGQNL